MHCGVEAMRRTLEKRPTEGTPVLFSYPLFKFFADEHNLSLTDSQLDDIIEAVRAQERRNEVR